MSKRRGPAEKRCPRCKINPSLCFCHLLTPIETKTHVLMIMHHREKHLTSNTASLAKELLPKSDLHLYGLPDDTGGMERVQKIIANKRCFFLYPDEQALDIAEIKLEDSKQSLCLIVPDGTWRQAKKIKRRNSLFNDIPCIKLPAGKEGLYQLRNQHKEEGLCTFEAIARALGVLEGKEGRLVQAQMEFVLMEMNRRFLVARHCF